MSMIATRHYLPRVRTPGKLLRINVRMSHRGASSAPVRISYVFREIPGFFIAGASSHRIAMVQDTLSAVAALHILSVR